MSPYQRERKCSVWCGGTLLDLTDEVDAGREGSVAFLPLSRADLTRVFVDELSSLDLAEEFGSVTTDTVVVDLSDLQFAIRIEEEGTTVSLTRFFAEDAESAREFEGHISEHRVFDLADGVGSVSPSLVDEVRVRADGVDIYTKRLELCIVVSEVSKLGGANEGEVTRVEEEHAPLTLEVFVRYFDETLVLAVSIDLELRELAIDDAVTDDAHSRLFDCSFVLKVE